jgi:glucoamylase
MRSAFGRPGIPPTWTSSAKDLVTTALGPSRLWATLGFGIINEVYWPATSEPQIRDLGFILANADEWIELKRARRYQITRPAPHIPLPRVLHEGPRYRFTFEVVPDPRRDVLLISYTLEGDYRVYTLLAPHLAGDGSHNTAWVDSEVFARNGNCALALVAGTPFSRASAGYVGESDGWQDFNRHGRMIDGFDMAEDGNVALLCELAGSSGELALGFNETPEGARTLAATSLAAGFGMARDEFKAGWEQWGQTLTLPSTSPELADEARLSATVLKVHEDRTFPGAIVASLSIPWGNTSNSRGGYHLVWTRDAVESALALLATGQREDAIRVVSYLSSTQLSDGHWHQNFYPDGRAYWHGVQLDETAFPILLVGRLVEDGWTPPPAVQAMIRRAAAFIVRVGPMSPQDRWEENSGANPFTLGVEVAALAASRAFLTAAEGDYAASLADYWNERLEDFCYVTDTPLARQIGVPGYYVRVAPPPSEGRPNRVQLNNRAGETINADELVGLEFMYLARLGLRRADDPHIVSSLAVVDAVLRVNTPAGRLYHRYNEDGYGEHEDGRPFDGNGVGRAWPLLSGERGHLALVAGEDPRPYLETMLRTAGRCGLLPEQVWDTTPIPDLFLIPGRPTGSAMPLVWAHAEFLKLLAASACGHPCERLRVVEERYGATCAAKAWHWRPEVSFERLPADRDLIIEDGQPFAIHFGFDGWSNAGDLDAQALSFGMYGLRFSSASLAGRTFEFTRRIAGQWEGRDHKIEIMRQ